MPRSSRPRKAYRPRGVNLEAHFQRFANMLLAAEREACAEECDTVAASADKAAVVGQYLIIRNGAEARRCAAAIRARRNK